MSRRVSAVAPTRLLGKSGRLSSVGPTSSYFTSNGSKAGLPQRRSSFHGKSSQPRTDPRPLNDRGFQQECIRTLTSYLLTHGYNLAISTKLLTSPATRDILNIVQFLFQKVDPNTKLSGKVEEDVPFGFKRLGYPFQISKSALYAAGSPHTWPGLLAALVWLVQLLLRQESSEESHTFDEGDQPFFESLVQSYECFLAVDDEGCERLQSAFRQQFEEDIAEHLEKIAQLKVPEVEEHLQKLTTEVTPCASLEAKKADFLSDKEKFNKIITSLQWHKQAAEKKLNERKDDLLAMKAEKKVILADIEELRTRVAAQEINLTEVERMQKEEDLLEVNIQPVVAKDEQLRKTAWEFELSSTNKAKDLEVLCDEYNERCRRLRPNLAEGQPLPGAQLQVTLLPERTLPQEILQTSAPGGLKQAILEVMESCKRYTNLEREELLIACKQEVYACEAVRQEKLDLISRNIATIKKVEALYKASKEKWEASCAAVVAEREELEAKVVAKELAAKKTDAEAEGVLKLWEQKYEAAASKGAEEVAAAKKGWLEVVDFILSAKEQMRDHLNNLKAKSNCQVDKVQQELSELLPSLLSL